MMTKDKIIEVLMNEFNSVYCDNCVGNFDENFDEDFNRCDECHRKSIHWSISPTTAELLAYKIIGE